MTDAASYVLELLPTWARRRADELRHLITGVGSLVDAARVAAYQIRREWLVRTASAEGLRVHGDERVARRWDGETAEEYRRRLLTLFETRLWGATEIGLLAVMRGLGQPNASLYELYKDGPSLRLDGTWQLDGSRLLDGHYRWAEFAILLPAGEPDTLPAAVLARWVAEINRVKPAHAKLAYFAIALELADACTRPSDGSGEVLATTQRRLDGTWELDGSVILGPMEVTYAF